VALLTIPVLVHFLGIREYGVWSLAYAVLAVMLIGEAGVSVATTVFLSRDLGTENPKEASETLTFVLSNGIVIAAVVGVLLWLFGPFISKSLVAFGATDRVQAERAVQIAALAVAVFILERVFVGIEQAFDRYRIVNALEAAQSLLSNIGLMVVAWAGGKSVAMMKWQVCAWTALAIVHCYFVSRLLRNRGLRIRWSGAKARRMLTFTAASWTSMLGSAAFSQCDRLIVGAVLGAPILGLYSAVTNITSRINSFSGMAVQPLVPSLSRDSAMTFSVESRVREAVHLNILIAVEAGGILCVLGDWVMSIMVPGARASHDILGLQIAALIYALYSINAPGYFILFSVGQEWKNAIIALSSAGLSLALIFVGARHFGFVGAIAGNAGYLGTLLMVGFGVRKVGIALGRYFSWVALPLLALISAFVVGLTLQDHFWWRAAFLMMQGILLLTWFSREQNGWARLRGVWGELHPGS
jgi:O-antigen/teichoic acid export membrane protein